MSLLDEEIVEYWLNYKGFFSMRGVKCGNGEIDFLAICPTAEKHVTWHVEVQVSFRPIGYIGGNSNAKRRTHEQVIEGVEHWIAKKFTAPAKISKRDQILPNAAWQMVLVCAELRHPIEAELMSERGVKIIRYADLIDELADSSSTVNSDAGNIVEIIRYLRKVRRA